MSMPAASGCITSRRRSSLCIFRVISRRCLRFISSQWCCLGWLVAPLFFSSGLDFMVTFPRRIQLGSARLAKTTQSRQRGRAVLLSRTTPATIYTIARTGAMLIFGQERSRENAALTAEPGCASNFSWARPQVASSRKEFQAHTTTASGGPCSSRPPSVRALLGRTPTVYSARREADLVMTSTGGLAHSTRMGIDQEPFSESFRNELL